MPQNNENQESDKLVSIGLEMARKVWRQEERKLLINKLVHGFLMFIMILGICGMYLGLGIQSWSMFILGFIIYGVSALPYFLVKNG